MSHEFVKTTWNNGASPAITAEQLNRIENAIDESISAINDLETGKQDELTFDNTPTANSQNPVTSGGIKQALKAKADLASPVFTGTPKAPTPSRNATDQIATAEFVNRIIEPIEQYASELSETILPEINDNISDLEDKADSIESSIAELKARDAEIDTRVDALETDTADLKSAISEIEPGLSDDAKEALLACFAHVVWDTPQASGYISLLENALYPSEYPKITTAFNPGTHVVYNVDTLDSLKPYLTVLYFETEESSGTTISNYTLSGELTGGTSRITATYNGLSSQFNVSVVDIDAITSWLYPSDITDKVIGSTQRVSSEDIRCVVNTTSTRWIVGSTITPLKIKDTSLNDMSIAPIKVPDGCTGATVTFTYTGSASDVKYTFTRLKKEDGYYKVITWTSRVNSGDRTAFTSSDQYLLLSVLSTSAQSITPTNVSIVFDSNS